MDAVEFLKERSRMCKMHYDCEGCAIEGRDCMAYKTENPEKVVEIVEKWSEKNPIHTYYDEFCKRFPKTHWTDVSEISAADFCVNDFFGDVVDCRYIDYDCENCWQVEYKGE